MRKKKGTGQGGNTHSVIDRITPEKLKELAALNLSVVKICACLGVAHTVYYDHRDEHPEWEQALKEGRALGVKRVAQSLINTAEKGNVTAQIFYLKNADPENWNKETTNVNTNVNIQSVADLSDDDLDKQIKKLEKQAEKQKADQTEDEEG